MCLRCWSFLFYFFFCGGGGGGGAAAPPPADPKFLKKSAINFEFQNSKEFLPKILLLLWLRVCCYLLLLHRASLRAYSIFPLPCPRFWHIPTGAAAILDMARCRVCCCCDGRCTAQPRCWWGVAWASHRFRFPQLNGPGQAPPAARRCCATAVTITAYPTASHVQNRRRAHGNRLF